MSVLTTSQLTFCDLKDSYSIHLDTECIGISCDNSGHAQKDQIIAINYRGVMGSTQVGLSCEVSDLPSGVTLVNVTSATETSDGVITLHVAQSATLGNEPSASIKAVFATGDEFTFEKYITLIKSIAGYDGTDSVDFQIYSTDGFKFSDTLTSITLKTAAFKGGNAINSDATYQWKWWNQESEATDKYELIDGAASSSLIINTSDDYAFSSIKCEMTYDGIVYEDYVSLTNENVIYTAIAKFFDGDNIISADENSIIIYVELYKDNVQEEFLYADKIYKPDSNQINGEYIETDYDGDHIDGDMMYFVCKTTSDGMIEHIVVLAQYTPDGWKVVNSNYKYQYKNNINNATSPIICISKEKISKIQNIDFEIYYGNTIISRTNAVVFDLNDPIISSEAPENPKVGTLWLNISESPSVLKMWNGDSWVKSSGNVVYTSIPTNGYYKGDLWVLNSNDVTFFKDEDGAQIFGEGTMLRSNTTSDIFDASHWEDVDEDATEQKKNIKQYFLFNKDTGLRIGQQDNQFYVNISSQEMGFYDASDGTPNKVVNISNQSATIRNTTLEGDTKIQKDVNVKGNANFYGQINICDPNPEVNSDDNISDALFIWKIEENGSLSLAIAT